MLESHGHIAAEPSSSHLISRRGLLKVSAVGGAALVAPALVTPGVAHADSPVDIVISEQPRAIIVHNGNSFAVNAATDLQTYIKRATGAMLPVSSTEPTTTDARIYVGYVGAQADPNLADSLIGIDLDGFVIATHNNSVTVLGASGQGTRFGVFEFLERFLDIRWLMPNLTTGNTLGEDVPHRSSLTIAAGTHLVDQPVFRSRRVSVGVVAPGDDREERNFEWLWRGRIVPRRPAELGRLPQQHNLWNIFNSNQSDKNNLWYPMRNGTRYVPPPNLQTGWQPQFSDPATGGPWSYTVDKASLWLFENMDDPVEAFSLAVNDNGGFSDDDVDDRNPDYPTDPIEFKNNSQGVRGKSNVYFQWVNAVLARLDQRCTAVGRTFTKTVTVLAYIQLADPPTDASITLDPRIVPFLTRDRYRWVQEARAEDDRTMLGNWMGRGITRAAWYDYAYGCPYVAPRIYLNAMKAAYSHAAANGVVGATVELYPNWGEGPKPWILSRLLWNPNQNVDALLTEWCTRAVGSAAAPQLKQYYQDWETFWTQQATTSSWFTGAINSNYFPMRSPVYLEKLSLNAVTQAENLLQQVINNTPSSTPYRARAEKIAQTFQYYKHSARSYPRPITKPASAAAAQAAVSGMDEARTNYNLRAGDIAAGNSDVILFQFVNNALATPQWLCWHESQFWGVVEYCEENEQSGGPVTTTLQGLATNSATEALTKQMATLALAILNGTATQRALNPSFEVATTGGIGVANWTATIAQSTPPGVVSRSTAQFRPGGVASLSISLATQAIPRQKVTAQAGLVACRAYVKVPPSTDPWEGTVQLAINNYNGASLISAPRAAIVTASSIEGEWHPLHLIGEVPATATDTEVSVIFRTLQNDPPVYLDDVHAYQI